MDRSVKEICFSYSQIIKNFPRDTKAYIYVFKLFSAYFTLIIALQCSMLLVNNKQPVNTSAQTSILSSHLQNILGMAFHQINQHIAKQAIRPGEPRSSVTVIIILEEALMHIPIRRTLFQNIQTSHDLLLVLDN